MSHNILKVDFKDAMLLANYIPKVGGTLIARNINFTLLSPGTRSLEQEGFGGGANLYSPSASGRTRAGSCDDFTTQRAKFYRSQKAAQ